LPASTYFTFEIDGARVGFYEEHDESVPAEDRAIPRDQEARVLRMCAWISLDGAQHLNRFAIRYVGDEIVAYLDATGAWVSLGPGAAAGTMTGAAASAATSATSNAASNAASNATASAESRERHCVPQRGASHPGAADAARRDVLVLADRRESGARGRPGDVAS